MFGHSLIIDPSLGMHQELHPYSSFDKKNIPRWMRCHVKCRGRGRGWACGRAAVCDGRAFHRYFSDSEMYLANCICQMQKIGLIEFCISTGGRAGVCDGRGGHLRIT